MTKNKFERLPQDPNGVKKIISDYLRPQEIKFLSETGKYAHNMFKPELEYRAISELLSYVVKGNQDAAERILAKKPELLLKTSNVTDFSGRNFKQVTAFQLALWAKDRHMRDMMIRCIPNDEQGSGIRSNLLAQYQDLETYGISYTMRPIIYQIGGQTYTITSETNSKNYNMQPLLDAMRFYIDHFNEWIEDDHSISKEREDYWCKVVGLIQSTLPAHILNEYCCPRALRHSFNPPLTFKEETLPRQFKFKNWDVGGRDEWFNILELEGFGVSWGIFRGTNRVCHGMAKGPGPTWNVGMGVDLTALDTLDNVRAEEIAETATILNQGMAQPATCPDVFGASSF